MKLSKRLKSKIKKNLTISLASIALVTTTLATLKLTGLSMPFSTKIESTSESSQIKSATITRLPNTETVTYIYDAADLVAFRDAVNAGDDYTGKTVYLMDDIDLSSVCSETIGSWEPIGTYVDTDGNKIYFAGTFDGNYHTISNLYYNGSTYQYVGFFSTISSTGVVQNLILSNVYIYNSYNSASSNTGGIAAYNAGIIQNCGIKSGSIIAYNSKVGTSNATRVSSNVGGITASSSQTITNCYNKATITGTGATNNVQCYMMVGGIVSNVSGTISNCYNSGTVTVKAGYAMAGGIMAHGSINQSITFKNCYNYGSVSGTGTSYLHIGGIVGRNGYASSAKAFTITNSYCTTATTYSYYYWNGSKITTSTTGRVAAATLQTYTVTLGNAFAYDVYGINSGYPVLAWENETTVMNLNKNQAYIGIGEKLTLNVVEDDDVTRIIENNYSAANFTWNSTNEDVATVNENGVVTGVSDGYTTIYAKHEESGLYAMCVVNVAKDKANPQIETGNGFTAILKTDGTVWTIGNNANGGLGDGTNKNTKVPVQVYVDEDTKLSNIIKIAVGTDHVLALTKDGKVYGWGSNTDGQLGQNNTNSLTYAKPVLSEDGTSYLSNIVDISANGYGSMALDKNGNVYVWGRGTTGEIGNNTTTSSNLPIKTIIKNAIQVSIGDGHTGVLTSEGVVWAWGQNTLGQLGINCANNTSYPMKTALNVTELSVGGYHTTVKKIDGTLYACRSIFLWKTRNRKQCKCYKIYKSKFTKYSNRYK